MNLALLLSEARQRRQLSLRQVAAKAGVNNPSICQLERGNTTNPTARLLFRLVILYQLDFKAVFLALVKDEKHENKSNKKESRDKLSSKG